LRFVAVFTIFNEGKGKMDILQTTEFKNIELISFDFEVCGDEDIRQQITFKYGSLKSKLALMEGRLQDINELLRLKNPSLLLQMQKNPGSSQLNQSKLGFALGAGDSKMGGESKILSGNNNLNSGSMFLKK